MLDLKRVLACPYYIRSIDLHLILISLKISTDKSTLISKLEVRIITDSPGNIDALIVNGMFLVQSHIDLPSSFGGEANMTVSSCQTCKSCRVCM